jgi:hypothetical protein
MTNAAGSSILAVLASQTGVLAPGDRSAAPPCEDDGVHDANAQKRSFPNNRQDEISHSLNR